MKVILKKPYLVTHSQDQSPFNKNAEILFTEISGVQYRDKDAHKSHILENEIEEQKMT